MQIAEQRLFGEWLMREWHDPPETKTGSIEGIPCVRMALRHNEPLHWKFYRYIASRHYSTVIQNVDRATYNLVVY